MGGKGYTGVRKASSSTIEITFNYNGVKRERVKLSPTPANLKKMARRREALLHAIDEGTFDYALEFPKSKRGRLAVNSEKISSLLDSWYDQRKDGWKASTVATYRRTLDFQLIPFFGELFIHELKWKHIMEFGESKPDIKSKTMSTVLTPLRQICKDAVGKEMIKTNPMEGKVLYRHKEKAGETRRRVDPYSPEERVAILNACNEPQVANRIQFGLWTGLRPCELAALDWEDIDFVSNTVHITKSLTWWAKEPEDPKTVKGIRTVPLLPDALAALLAQKEHTFMLKGRVFHNPRNGLPWDGGDTFRRNFWKPLLVKAGVRYRGMRHIRHTFASSMFMAGENPMWIAEVMGHEDWAFTAKTYSRFMPEAETSSGSKAAEMFGQKAVKKAVKSSAIMYT